MKPDAKSYDPRPEYLAELIQSAGLTQKKLGSILGVDQRTIRRWLAGDRQFPYSVQFTLESLILSPDECD